MVIQVDVLVLILFEWNKMLCGCMRWYLVNKSKGGDLIWSEKKRRKNTPMMENPI
jgi:hypothetical protein